VSNEFGLINQLGYIVPDVRATAAEWVQRVGAGPFYILDSIVQDQYYYRGARTDLELRLCFGYWGSMQIELITPLNKADTLYTRALRDSPGRLNHCATYVTDLDALLARHKLQSRVIQAGQMPTGLKYVYLEEYLPGGQHLELVQATEEAKMAFVGMEKIAQRWDGKNPLRPMSALGADLAALAAR
jgi:methylmalonyl-CoA/ethylmalonyl-CoA epimerase